MNMVINNRIQNTQLLHRTAVISMDVNVSVFVNI